MTASTKQRSSAQSGRRFQSWWWDILGIAVLIVTNPILYHLGKTSGKYPPDSIKYMMLGEEMLPSMQLFIAGMGTENAGLILPPFYPFLIALGAAASGTPWFLGTWINNGCLLLATIPLFLLIRPISGRAVAILAIVTIQINYFYFVNAFIPLTEALFILMLALALYLLQYSEKTPRNNHLLFLIGIVSCLLFFSRQIGMFFLAFSLLWVWTKPALPGNQKLLTAGKNTALIFAGFLLLFLPYAYLLHQQTGQTPFSQHFYISPPPSINTPPSTPEDHQPTSEKPVSEYSELLSNRRQLYRLTPDNSAMYSQLALPDKAVETGVLTTALLSAFSTPEKFLARLHANLDYLIQGLGPTLFWLFIASLFSPVMVRSKRASRRARYLIGATTIFYLLCISAFTGMIGRYALVILPLAILNVTAELSIVAEKAASLLTKKESYKSTSILLAALSLLAAASLMPKKYYDLYLFPLSSYGIHNFSLFKRFIGPGGAVLSMTPANSYLTGGSWRILPNESLERIAMYAKHNDIQWLIVRNPEDAEELQRYNRTHWYTDPKLMTDYRKYIQVKSFLPDRSGGGFILFRILTDKDQEEAKTHNRQ